MKVLITGGAGFIGSHFVHYLTNSNSEPEVVVLDALTYAGDFERIRPLADIGRIQFIQGDICDPRVLEKALTGVNRVYNFAAETHVDRSIKSSREFIRTNVVGVENILSISLRMGIKTFIQISTDEVYGSIESGSADELFPLMPNSPYAASKASADLICRSFQKTYDMDVRITRCSNNFGLNQFPEKLIPLAIMKFKANQKFPVYGTGTNLREWIHVKDHCKAIQLVAEQGESGGIYNIGSGDAYTNLAILNSILEKMKLGKHLLDYVPDRPGHDFRYSINANKIQSELGFKCDFNLMDSLDELILGRELN